MPHIEAIGIAVPGAPVPQATMRAKAEEVFRALAPDLLDKLSVFDATGIRQRNFVRPIEWYLESHGWAERSAVFAEAGLELAEQAARRALDAARVPASAVDGVILVTTTGIATPSLDARLIDRMGLRPDIHRVPVWGLGCAGGVAGLNLAADLARAHPERRYLLVSLETCSLAFTLNDLSVRAFVATTLFADGAAAALVRGDALEGASIGRITSGASHTWPATQDVMGWDVVDEGLRVVFSRRIPEIIRDRFAPIVQEHLKRNGGAVERHLFHPGGTKVIEAYQEALGLPAAAFDDAREILAEHGNMSSPTVLFVLDRSLRSAPLAPGERALLAALGPGFSADLAVVEG